MPCGNSLKGTRTININSSSLKGTRTNNHNHLYRVNSKNSNIPNERITATKYTSAD